MQYSAMPMSWQKQSCNWWRSIRQLSVSGKFVRCSTKKINMTINLYCEYCTYKVSYVVKYSRYNKKEKKKELDVIQQGIRLVQPEMASSQPLPAAAAKPASLPTVTFPAPFTHTLPQNTAGKANVRGNQRALPVISPVPLPIQPTTQMLMLPDITLCLWCHHISSSILKLQSLPPQVTNPVVHTTTTKENKKRS